MRKIGFRIEFTEGTRIEQIELSCQFLYVIFGTFFEPDSIIQKGAEFQEQVEAFSQIGLAFTDSIQKNISDFNKPDEVKDFLDVTNKPNEN